MEFEKHIQLEDINTAIRTRQGFANETSDNFLSVENILKDLAAGSVGGFANVLSGHPLDTVKVRMQMLGTNMTRCIQFIIKKEGLLSFYKGVYSPLYGTPAANAVIFGAYESARRVLAKDSTTKLTIAQGTLAGAWAGLFNCLVSTPIELIKVRQQMEGMGSKSKIIKTTCLVKQIIQNEGFSGLYKGNLIMILREIPGYAAQFGSYELVKEFLSSRYGESSFSNFLAGAVGGLMCWITSYPQDVIKTKLQCDYGIYARHYKSHWFIRDGGIASCTKDIYRQDGLIGFWRGFSACTIRAVIANAFMFVAYEKAKNLFMPSVPRD